MFEGAVAALLNRFLGNYIEDLDTENFNVGIFSGDAYLTELKLKTEALYQLGLPIKIKIGLIGKISLKIPWTGLTSQPVIVTIEDIYIIAGPALAGPYDPEIEKRLVRAAKKKILEDLDEDYFLGYGKKLDGSTFVLQSFEMFPKLLVHPQDMTMNILSKFYEYEIRVKWKPGVIATNSTSIYQLMRAESLSIYLNPKAETSLSEYPEKWELAKLLAWKNIMHRALQTFSINNQDFQFLMKPFTARIKIIINKSNEVRVPRMLVDVVLQDVATQITKQQYITFCQICQTLERMSINRAYRKYHPGTDVRSNCAAWWKYAYKAVIDRSVKPYTWEYFRTHRRNYNRYKNTYKTTLLRPSDTELKLDLQKYEDELGIVSIVVAREHAKIELKHEAPQHVTVEVCKPNLWDVFDESDVVKFVVNREKAYGVCTQLSSPERKLIQIMENGTDQQTNVDKLPQYIDHKYNFTLANCSLSLLHHEKEVLVVTLTQFLASVETRPYASAFKISARAESFVIEGASSDNELISLITADNVLTGNMASNFLSVDFEKNSLNSYANFDISVTLEPIEIMYHEYAISEIINFFKTNDVGVHNLLSRMKQRISCIKDKCLNTLYSIPSRQKRINLKMDLKGPYIVLPLYGSAEREKNLLLLDIGRIMLKSELQTANVQFEDATLMELEELLYDRLHISFTDGQILFCHADDDWREAKKLPNSENHLLPKIQSTVTLSHSVKIDYRVLPRTKLNVSISSLKLNLSERKLNLLADFLSILPLPNRDNTAQEDRSNVAACYEYAQFHSFQELDRLRRVIAQSSLVMQRFNCKKRSNNVSDLNTAEVEKSIISSEISEEDMELWVSTVELPGFDDNISPHNSIKLLLRFVIGEFCIHWEQSLMVDKPYVTLSISALCLEAAIMDYGASTHFSIGGILLADKTNAGVTGSYLELISTNTAAQVITILYRKVTANCPDFKSHFKSTEQSLIIDVAHINIIFHRQSFLKLKDYYDNISKIQHLKKMCNFFTLNLVDASALWFKKLDDPPVPPGATKLSYSARLNMLQLTLCDVDTSLLEIKISGLESDCIYKANERMILRLHLRGLNVIDLSDLTLYSRIVTVDEDKVLDFKYVRHTPKFYKHSDIDARQDDVMSDGSLKMSLGQINIIFISKIFHDCGNFIEPFSYLIPKDLKDSLVNSLLLHIKKLKNSATKLHLSLDLHGPTFLFPQKKDVPSLLVFNTGILTIENFFKAEEQVKHNNFSGNNSDTIVIDNILIELRSVTLSRAIMMLSGNLETQEPILEPVYVRLDVKRKINRNASATMNNTNQCVCHCDLKGAIDMVLINIGHRDLTSALSIWEDNISKIFAEHLVREEHVPTGVLSPNINDVAVEKLEAFFAQNEQPFCEINLKLSLDGLQLNLFTDTEEILSSPVRDLNHGLCRLTIGEVTLSLDVFNNKSLLMKISVRSCLLEDIRRDETIIIRKIIQSHSQNIGADVSNISISTPPILDVTFQQTQAGDRCIDVLIEETRFNLSMSFLVHIAKYILDSIPGDPVDKGVVNRGYIGDITFPNNDRSLKTEGYDTETLSTANNHSNFQTVQLEEQPGVSISIRIRKPELLVFGDLKASNAHAILFQAELIIENSIHDGVSSIVFSLSDLQAKSKSQAEYKKQPPHWVLRPCDIEITRMQKLPNHDVHVTSSVSSVDIHLSASTIQTFTDIIQEAILFLKSNEMDSAQQFPDYASYSDLWSQKKIHGIPYKVHRQDSLTEIVTTDCYEERCETFQLKPVSLCILLEMEDTIEKVPVMMVEFEIDAFLQDWNHKFQMESVIKLQASCYNVNVGAWEPLIEPCIKEDNIYKPWQLTCRVYQSEAYDINNCDTEAQSQKKEGLSETRSKRRGPEDPETENNDGMVFIHPDHPASSKMTKDYSLECNDDSDSDNEGSMRTLTGTFGHLFVRGESDDESSDTDVTSGDEDEGVHISDDNIDDSQIDANCPINEDEIKKTHQATYVILDAKDKLNVTITPNTMNVCGALMTSFVKSRHGIPIVATNAGKLILRNDIGYASRVELLARDEEKSTGHTCLIAAANYHTVDSAKNTPSSPECDIASETIVFTATENFDEVFNDCSMSYKQNEFSFVAENPTECVSKVYNMVTEERLRIEIEGFEDAFVYCPRRHGYKLVSLQPIRNGIRYHLLVHVETNERFHRTITVCSPLQIRNETSFAISLYYKKKIADDMKIPTIGESFNPFGDNVRIGIIEPDETFNVPLYAAYHLQLYVQPSYIEKYQVSETGICWRELSNDLNSAKDIYCSAKDDTEESVFTLKVLCAKRITVQTNSRIPNYQIRILPPLVFHSRIPFSVDIKIPSIKYDARIEPGEHITIYTLKLSNNPMITFEVQNYLGNVWTSTVPLTSERESKLIKMFPDNDVKNINPLVLCMKQDLKESWAIVIYAQYWIINKTGIPLHIRESCSNVVYEIQSKDPVVFAFKKNRHHLVRLRAQQSGWSPAFNLDAVDTTGLIICKDAERKRKYEIQLHVTISQLCPLLTKIVTLLPNFLVINKTRKNLRFLEDNEEADLWLDLSAGQVTAFWPYTDSMRMCIKWSNSQLVSQYFDITKIQKTVLRMDSGTAVCVEVCGGNNAPFSITFHKYQNGDAPVRIDNVCDNLFLKFHQTGMGQVALLNPYQSLLYTWDEPTKKRELIWNVYNNEGDGYVAKFSKDGHGQESVPFRTLKQATSPAYSVSLAKKLTFGIKSVSSASSTEDNPTFENTSIDNDKSESVKDVCSDQHTVFWVSFMEKRQRVLLFTQDENIFRKVKSIIDPEICDKEFFLSLSGIGLSISMESAMNVRELSYFSITDSSAMWELYFGKRWKTLSLELSAWMEDRYQNSFQKTQLEDLIDVDFEKMHMTKPFYAKLKRTYSPGIWLHCRTSASYLYARGKVHRIQIDNQLHDAVFPVVLYFWPQRSISRNIKSHKMKPCLEFSFLKQTKGSFDNYKNITVIIREFALNLHKDFLVCLLENLNITQTEGKPNISLQLRADLSSIHASLSQIGNLASSVQQRHVIEHLYISPLKLQLRLLGGTGGLSCYPNESIFNYYNFIEFMFNYSHGALFEKVADITLPHYEKTNVTSNLEEIYTDIKENYSAKLMQQFNIMICALTVVGNPYGYNFKIHQDVCDSNPKTLEDEMAEKISQRVEYLLGHVTTDITPSITSIFENSFPCAPMHSKENKFEVPNCEIPLSILLANNAFPIGVELEMSGIIIQPTNSIHKEELKHFFKGLGKGIFDLTMKKNVNLNLQSGLIIDAIKRAQAIGYEFVSRIRLPRYINLYLGAEPYSVHKATGMHLLHTISKGHYLDKDAYWAHAALSREGKYIALVSLRRVFLIEKRCLWGSWNVEWVLDINTLIRPPVVTSKKLILHVNKNDNLLDSQATDWYIESEDEITLEWLRCKIETVMILNMENDTFIDSKI